MNEYKISQDYLDLEQLLDEKWKMVRDPYRGDIGCLSYPIIIVNGQQGLLSENQIILEPKYLRVIKLTYCHYLCQEPSNYILYKLHEDDLSHLEILATITTTEELTLEGLLQILSKDHPLAYTTLSKNLYRRGALYISDYRLFDECIPGHVFTIARQRVMIDNNFHVRPWDVDFV